MFTNSLIAVVLNLWLLKNSLATDLSTKSIEQMAEDYEGDKNSMLAVSHKEDDTLYEDFYDEADNRLKTFSGRSMNIIYFGDPLSFMRLDAETIMHLLSYTKTHLVPRSRAILAWDLITDGKTAAFLSYREFLAFGKLLNVIPEEDLFYVNFADNSVLKFFSRKNNQLNPRKIGILVAAYRRYYGDIWFENSTDINSLGYLLCGFPASDFKKITPAVFKDISNEALNRIQSCSSEQLQTMYRIATHKDAYGSPYKWTSHEITKLSMLFGCIPNHEISSIQLEAIPAIEEEVMKVMEQEKLTYFTKQQVLRMDPKTRRIFILRMQLRTSLDMTQLTRKRSSTMRPSMFLSVLSLCSINIIASKLFFDDISTTERH